MTRRNLLRSVKSTLSRLLLSDRDSLVSGVSRVRKLLRKTVGRPSHNPWTALANTLDLGHRTAMMVAIA
jgi:hypothetical protein